MFFKRIAIIGSFALTTLTSAVAAAAGGALEGRLRSAADRGDAGEVRTLLDASVNVDHANRLGWTALLEAIMLGDGSERYMRIVQLLVDGRASVNLADSNGATPLQHARRRGYGANERVLGAAGAR
ncbi:ankyrin repeat domain-containing protein [Burkholderia sp. Ac-20344]|uniref:ankyrin repeat domain-containing protein n=1 Tax=Burkholderia sp. Ac-20344 TaxID=2703890 RepID=UPI00197B9131|nr:ankyrin repeat domain-containing protein [Burkholderia sp. Ac-20344]MBN3833007.1 ankyrin repeat domain-containing protein [Burkholderia sp. Ac-20344]